MQKSKFAGHMAKAAKTRERLPTRAVQGPDEFIQAVRDVHVILRLVRRKNDPPRRAVSGKIRSPSFNEDIPFEVAHFVENLDAFAISVGYINKSVIRDNHAMHDPQKHAADAGIALLFRSLAPKTAPDRTFRPDRRQRCGGYRIHR